MDLVYLVENLLLVSFSDGRKEFLYHAFRSYAEKFGDMVLIDIAEHAYLVYIFHCITDTSFRYPGDDFYGFSCVGQLFLIADVFQMGDHIRIGDLLEIEYLATRDDGIRDFVDFRSR